MLCLCYRRTSALLVCAFFAGSVHAEIFIPGQVVPGISSNPFVWSLDEANSTYGHWDFFEGVPGNTAGGPISDNTADVASFGNAHSINIGPGSLNVGSGNAYSPFAALTFDSFVNPVTGPGLDNTRVVMQLRTSGAELDPDSVLMNVSSVATAGTLAPTLHVETGRAPFAGPFGSGVDVDHFIMWDVPTNTQYRIDFDAAASSLSLTEFRIDTFSQTGTFAAVSAIPEPSFVFAIAFIFGLASLQTYRRRRQMQRELQSENLS